MGRVWRGGLGLALLVVLVAGCASAGADLTARSAGAAAAREYQQRQYDTPDEERILTVCTLLLQDLGFQIDETTAALGVLSASKVRDANRLTPAERFGIGVVQFGLLVGGYTAPLALFLLDTNKEKPVKIEIGITTRKTARGTGHVSVSVSFKENDASITDPAIYQAFFDHLTKALLVEARAS
jgi:hypothetical protein